MSNLLSLPFYVKFCFIFLFLLVYYYLSVSHDASSSLIIYISHYVHTPLTSLCLIVSFSCYILLSAILFLCLIRYLGTFLISYVSHYLTLLFLIASFLSYLFFFSLLFCSLRFKGGFLLHLFHLDAPITKCLSRTPSNTWTTATKSSKNNRVTAKVILLLPMSLPNCRFVVRVPSKCFSYARHSIANALCYGFTLSKIRTKC